MNDTEIPQSPAEREAPARLDPAPPEATRARHLGIPSLRLTALLAGGMLALGVAVGAAIGPAPDASYAGGASAIVQRLPLLLAAIAGHSHPSSPASAPATSSVQPPPSSPQATPAPASSTSATPASTTTTPTQTSAEEPASSTPSTPTKSSTPKLPAVTNVWLIELAGAGFAEALAQPSAAPYITGQLIPASTLLGSWSTISANAFAAEAALAEPPAAGAAPPLLHSIVQPPCPEGAAGAVCATGTPGQLTAADEFLKATLAQITSTPIYKEHGLVVVTFATVGIAAQAGLPAGASSATATYQPPAGAALMSPFAHAGARSSIAFNPTSPRQSLEKLLH